MRLRLFFSATAMGLVGGLALTGAPQAQAQASLCSATEQVVFACRVKPSNKLVSLCARDLGGKAASLQYRFGRPGQLELVHPKPAAGSLAQFRYSHYGRYRVDRTEVRFENQGVGYAVYFNYEGDEGNDRYLGGVTVTRTVNGNDTEVDLPCTGTVRSNLPALQAHLACAPNAVGGCNDAPTGQDAGGR